MTLNIGKTGKPFNPAYCGKDATSMSRAERYGWEVPDEIGDLKYIDKALLTVDRVYQRKANKQRVMRLVSNWSWVACGTIIVAENDGIYYVIDGQHRVLAAKKISKITDIPCIVFKIPLIKDEADAWLNANTNRKLPTSIEKFSAQITRGDADAIYLKETCDRLGIIIKDHSEGPMQMQSTLAPLQILSRDKERFDKIMILIAELCADYPIKVKLLQGLDYIAQRLDINEPRLRKRILKVGPSQLMLGANKAAAFYSRGGANVWAGGMLEEINYKLPNKYNF